VRLVSSQVSPVPPRTPARVCPNLGIDPKKRGMSVEEASGRTMRVDQCPPNTRLLFDNPETLISHRWDPKRQKNTFVARPTEAFTVSQWEIDKYVRDAPKIEADAQPPPVDEGVRSLRPPTFPDDRSTNAYVAWCNPEGSTRGAAVHRVKRHGPGVAPPGYLDDTREHTRADAVLATRGSLSTWVAPGEDTLGATIVGTSTVRQTHAPLSSTEYVSRRVLKGCAGDVTAVATPPRARDPLRLTHGRAPGAADDWKTSHFHARSRSSHGVPADALDAVEAATRTSGFGVAATLRTLGARGSGRSHTRGGFSATNATAERLGVTTTGPRATFKRSDNSGGSFGLVGDTWVERRTAGAERKRAAEAARERRSGNGRGGGALPVDDDAVERIRAEREARIQVPMPSTFTSRPGTCTGGSVGFDDDEEFGTRTVLEQERVSPESHLARLRTISRSLNGRQTHIVGRRMETARKRIEEDHAARYALR